MFDSQQLLAGIQKWVEIESPTSAPQAVNAMMDKAIAEYQAAGLIIERIKGRNGRGDHFKATSPFGGDGPGILVLSHLDTVHPIGTLGGPLPFKIDGDKAYGPGIYDMKAGAYLALQAYKALVAQPQSNGLPIRFLVTGDEETGSTTSKDLIEQAGDNAKYVLVTEPARDGDCCVTGRKGAVRYQIRFKGRPAHSGSRHHEGRSAIKEMARHILDLEALTNYDTGLTINIGMVEGGTARNVIPEHAEIAFDARILKPEQAIEIIGVVENLKAYDPDVQIEVEGGIDRPPFAKTPAIDELYQQARSLAAEIGIDLKDVFTGGGSDGNFLADRLPVLDGLGADGEGAHTLHEHIRISSLVPHAQLFKRLFESLR